MNDDACRFMQSFHCWKPMKTYFEIFSLSYAKKTSPDRRFAQHSDVGAAKSRSFLTLFASLSSSAAASVRIDILSGVIISSVPLVLGVRLLAPLESELGPLGVPGEPDFLCSRELKKLARTPSPDGAPGVSFPSI
jgi:hypothetical protein